ncbi:MAG: TonB family protein [Candidatus Aminicenantales bacterium]
MGKSVFCAMAVISVLISGWPISAAEIVRNEIQVSGVSAKYEKWLDEEVPYIITPREKQVFLRLKTDEDKEYFIESFWRERDPDPATPENEYKAEHYRRLDYANRTFGSGAMPGWKSDRGRFHIILGDAQPDFMGILKLRIFEGLKEGSAPAQSITSSYLKYMLSASIPADPVLEAEQNQIRKTFNLKDVKLVTESDMSRPKGKGQDLRHMFRLDGKLYEVILSSRDLPAHRFQILVNELAGEKRGNLLDTEFTIPKSNIAVFGFEDSQGNPIFISLREKSGGTAFAGSVAGGIEGGIKGGVSGGIEGGVKGEMVGGVVGGVLGVAQNEETERKRKEFRKGAVPCEGDIQPPKLLKKVDPVYPEEAREKGIQGVVILEAKIDESGRVMDTMILRSVTGLDEAAGDAVKQWVYEPMIIEGKPTKALFTVTVNFRLSEKDIEKFAEGAVKVKDAIPPPKLVKKISPVYPEAARKAGVEGVVILEARTDVDGRVKGVRVLRSVPLLDPAAIDAVRQWAYEPLIIDGQPKEAIFTTTVRFALNGKEKKKPEGEISTGEVLIPRLIKKVDPVYPEAARKAGIQGLVLLEATTDEKGNIAAVRVLKSIPELDGAAIDALKQWKYDPVIVEGKPKGVVFTVTIQFRLQ